MEILRCSLNLNCPQEDREVREDRKVREVREVREDQVELARVLKMTTIIYSTDVC
jgi:hypothetical protein